MAAFGGRQIAKNRVFTDSDYFLPRAFVDAFTSDITPRKPPPVNAEAHQDNGDDIQDTPLKFAGGDPTDGESQEGISDCARNWKAAASDEHKKMWAIFDETGIFAAACRHGLILWLVDMVQSGELCVILYFVTCTVCLHFSQSQISPGNRRPCNQCYRTTHLRWLRYWMSLWGDSEAIVSGREVPFIRNPALR